MAKGSLECMRFLVAISYARERLDFVQAVVGVLARNIGRKRVLFDKYHEAEFARRGLRRHLLTLYETDSELLTALICPDYRHKPWCQDEWRTIGRVFETRPDDVMLLRIGDIEDEEIEEMGLDSEDFPLDVSDRTPDEVATRILERLEANQISSVARSRVFEKLIRQCPPPYRRNMRRIYRAIERGLDSWCHGGNKVNVITGPPGCGKSIGIAMAIDAILSWTSDEPNGQRLWIDKDDIRRIGLSSILGDGECATFDDFLYKLMDAVLPPGVDPRPQIPSKLSPSAKIARIMSHAETGLLLIVENHELLHRSSVGERAFNAWLRAAACAQDKNDKCIIVVSQRRVSRWDAEGSPFNVGAVEDLDDQFELPDVLAHHSEALPRETLSSMHDYIGGHPMAWEILSRAIEKSPDKFSTWNGETHSLIIDTLSPYLFGLLHNARAINRGDRLLAKLCRHPGGLKIRQAERATARDLSDIGVARLDYINNTLYFRTQVGREFFSRELGDTSSWMRKFARSFWGGDRPNA